MKLDPHIHSKYSEDSKSNPKDIIKKAESLGLDIIAISDHNTVKGSRLAIEESKDSNVLVIPSIEISSSKGHILGFGVEEDIPRGLSPEMTVDIIHNLGGIAIVPHPFSFYRHGLFSNFNNNDLDIEGVEVKNARYILGVSNSRAENLAKKRNLAQIGASDSHFINSIGDCYTKLLDIAADPSIDDVIESIISKKTIPKGERTSNYLIAKEVLNKKIKKKY